MGIYMCFLQYVSFCLSRELTAGRLAGNSRNGMLIGFQAT